MNHLKGNALQQDQERAIESFQRERELTEKLAYFQMYAETRERLDKIISLLEQILWRLPDEQ